MNCSYYVYTVLCGLDEFPYTYSCVVDEISFLTEITQSVIWWASEKVTTLFWGQMLEVPSLDCSIVIFSYFLYLGLYFHIAIYDKSTDYIYIHGGMSYHDDDIKPSNRTYALRPGFAPVWNYMETHPDDKHIVSDNTFNILLLDYQWKTVEY